MLIDNEIRLSCTDLHGEMAKMKIFKIHFLFHAFLFSPKWNLITWKYENN